MAIKIKVGMVYKPKGMLNKNQVITSIQDETNFIKAPVWESDRMTLVGLYGGGHISEISTVVGFMSNSEIETGFKNFLECALSAKEKK